MQIFRRSHTQSTSDQPYVLLAAEIYSVTICIHTDHSTEIYKSEDDCPNIHLIKLKSEHGYHIYLPTEKNTLGADDSETRKNLIDADGGTQAHNVRYRAIDEFSSVFY